MTQLSSFPSLTYCAKSPRHRVNSRLESYCTGFHNIQALLAALTLQGRHPQGQVLVASETTNCTLAILRNSISNSMRIYACREMRIPRARLDTFLTFSFNFSFTIKTRKILNVIGVCAVSQSSRTYRATSGLVICFSVLFFLQCPPVKNVINFNIQHGVFISNSRIQWPGANASKS